MAEKKLKKSRALSKELAAKRKTGEAKALVKKIGTRDAKKIETVLATIRAIYPKIDDVLTPLDVLDGIGINTACPSCLSCFSCQKCASCQTCDYCLKCESCNTCQKQGGEMGCPMEGSNITPNPEEIIRWQLKEAVRLLSKRLV